MARTRIGGGAGGITMITGHALDAAAWDLEVGQQVDDTTNYNDTTWGSSNGSGVLNARGTVSGFLVYAATSTSPGLASISSTGGTATLTAATGCTYSGIFIVENARIQHRKVAGAIPVTYSIRSNGTITETWATT